MPRGFNRSFTIYIYFDISFLGCGGLMTATKGLLQSSPNNCTWKIQLTPGAVIKLNFTRFNLQQSDNCTKEYVLIKNGISIDSPLIGRYCGSQMPTNITSTGYNLIVHFITDGNNNKTGFQMIYERVILGISEICVICLCLNVLRSCLSQCCICLIWLHLIHI